MTRCEPSKERKTKRKFRFCPNILFVKEDWLPTSDFQPGGEAGRKMKFASTPPIAFSFFHSFSCLYACARVRVLHAHIYNHIVHTRIVWLGLGVRDTVTLNMDSSLARVRQTLLSPG